jgi:hypothetical protein
MATAAIEHVSELAYVATTATPPPDVNASENDAVLRVRPLDEAVGPAVAPVMPVGKLALLDAPK